MTQHHRRGIASVRIPRMSDSPTIKPELLDILVCALTRSKLRLEGDELIAQVGGLRYPIRDGIPVMLIEEAKLPEGIESLDAFGEQFKDQIPD